MTKSEALINALKDDHSRGQLFSVEEILEGYRELLESHDLPADYKIPLRTFRYWVNKSLFYAPVRKKFNQALYPAKTIFELLAVRILQMEFNLSLDQIKLLFQELPIGYWEGVAGIKREQKERKFQKALFRDPYNLSSAKKMLLSCSGIEEQNKWWREYLGVETDEEASEMRVDMARVMGLEVMETPNAEPYLEHKEYLRRRHTENLKQLASVFKKYDEKKYQQYQSMTEGKLLKEALKANDQLTGEEGEFTLIQKFEAQLKIYLIKIVNAIKRKGLSHSKALEAINKYKKAIYQWTISELKIKQIESDLRAKYVLKYDLNLGGRKPDREEIFIKYPYEIVTLDYGEKKVVAVIRGALGEPDTLLAKSIIPVDWPEKYNKLEQFRKRNQAFNEKWAYALEKAESREITEE